LSRDDWIDAATDALRRSGPAAVAVQPLARHLGATKGSFYWHFGARDDLLRASLERWAHTSTDDVIADIEAGDALPAERAKRLFARVTAHSAQYPGELAMLAAVDEPAVVSAVEQVTATRIDYIAGLLRAVGLRPAAARRRAVLAYAAYLGHAQLAHAVPSALPDSPRARRALVDEMTAVLLG